MKINIYHLFADLLNLYGDKGNIETLVKRCRWRGIDAEVKVLCAGQTPDFSDTDIVLLGGGSDREQLIVSRYKDNVSPPLKEYAESGGVLLAVCAGFQMLGNFYESEGARIPCFGILDIDTVSGNKRLIGNITIEANLGGRAVKIAGFENHAGRTDIKNHAPLGKVLRGFGNDGGSKSEGVIYKNVIATYLHGPLLPKNPELADYLILTALRRKYGDEVTLAPLDDEMELKAKEYLMNIN